MEQKDPLYLRCMGCRQTFEADEPHVAKAHEGDCDDPWRGYEILTAMEV